MRGAHLGNVKQARRAFAKPPQRRTFAFERLQFGLGHADRLLRLRTLYMSDDARDLVAIVGERYKEDVARFGYVFPANSSAPTLRS